MSKKQKCLYNSKQKSFIKFKNKNVKGELALKRLVSFEEKLRKKEEYEETQSLIDSLYSSFNTIKSYYNISEESLKDRLPLFYDRYLNKFNRTLKQYRDNNQQNNISVTNASKKINLIKIEKQKFDFKKFKLDLEVVMKKMFIYKSYDEYKRRVYKLTEENISKKKIIDINLCGQDYHLDYKFSVYAGWKSRILPELIASTDNLEILPSKFNTDIKGKNCSISLRKLILYNLDFCKNLINKNTRTISKSDHLK